MEGGERGERMREREGEMVVVERSMHESTNGDDDDDDYNGYDEDDIACVTVNVVVTLYTNTLTCACMHDIFFIFNEKKLGINYL